MRTAFPTAAPPRDLRWQTAFIVETYRPLSPIVWHHAFVSASHMTNWRGGSDLITRWELDSNLGGNAEISNVCSVSE
jgi:hypothetical protein